MIPTLRIGDREIGIGRPVYVVAEMSANHNQNFDEALRILKSAKDCGADAVKIQTYTPDSITIDCDNQYFRIGKGTLWEGRKLYELYGEAYTPWEWQPKLKKAAQDLGLTLFSSPFDHSAVDFLEEISMPAYKVASFELVDLPLLRRVAKTGKPVILSTGMATLPEIKEAVSTLQDAGVTQIALLKCTSSYPAPAEEMNLRAIPYLSDTFALPVGLSDHTLGAVAAVAAVALGACIIEKHFTLSRSISGPDSAFSMEPEEFKEMVRSVRLAEKSLGEARFGVSAHEAASIVFRRSLFTVKDVQAGEPLTEQNVRSIRPGNGLHTRHLGEILGRCAVRNIPRGTPLSWDLVEGKAGLNWRNSRG